MKRSAMNTPVIHNPASVSLGKQTLKPTSRDGQYESSLILYERARARSSDEVP